MTNQTISNYGRVLFELEIPREDIEECGRIFAASQELSASLASPIIPVQEKDRVIDRVFSESMRNFVKVVTMHDEILHVQDIIEAYILYVEGQKGILRAQLSYVTPPNAKQMEGIRSFIKKEFGASDVEMSEETDTSLIGGFMLRVGSQEYDWSTKGQLERLGRQLSGN